MGSIRRIRLRATAAVAALLASTAAWAESASAEPSVDADETADTSSPSRGSLPETPAEPSEIDEAQAAREKSPPPEDEAVAQARDAFRLGSTLARQGQWNDALAAYERSARLNPHPVTTYNIGYVERALGHYTRARAAFSRALDTTAWPEGVALPPNLATEARSYLAEVDRKLARVVVTVDPPNATITIDGRALDPVEGDHSRPLVMAGTATSERARPAPAPVFDLLVDPGAHVIVLSLPTEPDKVMRRTFASGASASLELSMHDEEPAAAPATSARMTVPVQDRGVESAGLSRTWAWVAYGVGGAGLATWAGFGISALKKDSFLKDQCPNHYCPPESPHTQYRNKLTLHSNLATAGVIVGGAGVAAGTLLLLMTRGDKEESARATDRQIEPWVGLGSAGVRGTF